MTQTKTTTSKNNNKINCFINMKVYLTTIALKIKDPFAFILIYFENMVFFVAFTFIILQCKRV